MLTRTALLFSLTLASHGALACISQETESNDAEADADGPVCSSQSISGDIDSRRDQDWYYFDVNEAASLTVSLNHDGRDDFDWYLYDPQQQLYAAETSSVPEAASVNVDGAGLYTLKVTRYRGQGAYTLDVNGIPDGSSGGGDTGGGDTGGGTGDGNCDQGTRPSKPGGLTSYLVGNEADVCVSQADGGLLVMGGGTDVDNAFTRRVKPLIGGGDVVVLRTSGSDGYNDYLLNLLGADSVETLMVDRTQHAESEYVAWAVRTAEFVWIAGGDQSDYLNQWQGTALQTALDEVLARGGVLGGTSAGAAVQSEYIYDPDGVLGAYSSEAVTDLCHENINISTGFLTTATMQNVIVDTHFAERDRMGRLMAFMAGLPNGIRGIGVDEATSIFFTSDGQGVVDGVGNVYVLAEDATTSRTQASCGSPVIYEDVLRYQLSEFDGYNILTGESTVSPKRIGIDGRNSNFYINQPYQ
ncbi:cyanophycinase [Microbulbifer flavimaris]|uniref:Cyanophycinase n=1 Tax=Microbulbifer flavimaris TaxID=1781068 RepID=A0ABX4I4R7_9GAMM|nr:MULTISPECIES: Type 1 glutamine amidotransferase-like domain-containing protein [Microbulbifer]KUJ84428.1 cyanophycinase [Microbulbifer sp. ZGT114]PCO06514.1 cyanophycinase [Microbulbifer flavimaris]